MNDTRFIKTLFFFFFCFPLLSAVDISSCQNITSEGSYTLIANLTENQSSGACIHVLANNTEINLGWNSITGINQSSTYGIQIMPYITNTTIKNGYIAYYSKDIYLTWRNNQTTMQDLNLSIQNTTGYYSIHVNDTSMNYMINKVNFSAPSYNPAGFYHIYILGSRGTVDNSFFTGASYGWYQAGNTTNSGGSIINNSYFDGSSIYISGGDNTNRFLIENTGIRGAGSAGLRITTANMYNCSINKTVNYGGSATNYNITNSRFYCTGSPAFYTGGSNVYWVNNSGFISSFTMAYDHSYFYFIDNKFNMSSFVTGNCESYPTAWLALYNNTINATSSVGDCGRGSRIIGNNITRGYLLYRGNNTIIANNIINGLNSTVASGLIYGSVNEARYYQSRNASIYNNTVIGFNSSGGIYLRNADNVLLYNNVMQNNKGGQGFFLNVSNSTIYNNIFNATNTTTQIPVNVSEIRYSNFWNISKTFGTNIIGGAYLGGNYYSNYTGSDADGDGIGQTNYTLNLNNTDFLPLVNNATIYLVSNCTDITLSGNYNITADFHGTANPCIQINAENVSLNGNNYTVSADNLVIKLISSNNVSIYNFNIPQTNAIRIDDDVINLIIRNNTFDVSATPENEVIGFDGTNMQNINITENIFSGNDLGLHGISFTSSTNSNELNIFNNTFSRFTDAIYFEDTQNNVSIYNNYFLNMSSVGISALSFYASDAIIFNNYFNISYGTDAIDLGGDDFFLNTTKTLGTNIIGGSYIGGNYYSDYTGWDTNGDGLGETSYNIDGINDYYPLTYNSDTVSPSISFVFPPTENSGASLEQTFININVSAYDNYLKNITINLYNSTGSLINSTKQSATLTNESLFVNYTSLAYDLYFYNATAYDIAGNYNSTETRNITLLQNSSAITNCVVINIQGQYAVLNNLNGNISGGYCINVNASNVLLDVNNYSITGADVANTYGIYSNGQTNITVINGLIKDYYYGIYIDKTNSSSFTEMNLSSSGYNVYLTSTKYNQFSNDVIENSAVGGIYLTSSNSNNITNNLIYGNYGAIKLYSSTGNNLSNNIIDKNHHDGAIIYFNSASSNIIQNNSITNSVYSALLEFSSSSSNNISNNSFLNTPTGWIALYIQQNSASNLIQNNIIKNFTADGIVFSRSNSNIVKNNQIEGMNLTDGIGIMVFSANAPIYCQYNQILNNTVNNSWIGIRLGSNARYNTIANNTIQYNSQQMQLFDGLSLGITSNTIYNNIFIASAGQMLINSTISDTNSWNISKTLGTNIIGGPYIGGNYYSNYTGWDGNLDGLGESNYTLSTGNVDFYPLTNNLKTTAPEIYFVVPTENSGVSLEQTFININVSAYDLFLKNITIYLYNSTGSLINSTTQNATLTNESLFVNYTALPYDTYFYNATAYDLVGNLNTTETRNITLLVITYLDSCSQLNNSGIYYLNSNLTGTLDFGICLYITADNVKINFKGYSMLGNNSGYGIYAHSHSNITIIQPSISNYNQDIFFNYVETATPNTGVRRMNWKDNIEDNSFLFLIGIATFLSSLWIIKSRGKA